MQNEPRGGSSSCFRPNGIVDFTRSIPPVPALFPRYFAETLENLAHEPDFSLSLRNGIAAGSERDRAAGAAWIAPRFGEALEPGRIMVTNGTQGALLLLLAHYANPGDLVLAERLSYGVLRQLAERARVRLRGLELDEEGILPDAFEAACRRERPKLLYCNPTVHNPTTAMMSKGRRMAIAEIARQNGVIIVEDEPLGRLHPGAPSPIAAFAPDVTWYIMSTTKCLAHGLRIAYAVGPTPAVVEALVNPVRRLSHWFPAPLSASLVTRWIENGTADKICADICDESSARQKIAERILGNFSISCPDASMHLWLRLPSDVVRTDVKRRLEEQGVMLRLSDDFVVDDHPLPNAMRLSLSSPPHRQDVSTGLEKIARVLGTA